LGGVGASTHAGSAKADSRTRTSVRPPTFLADVDERRRASDPRLRQAIKGSTSTHGATEHVFALFDLLGLRFIPRLCDAGELRLHRLGAPTRLPVDAILRARARPAGIREHYDELLRTAASLKRGWVPASLLLTRLRNSSPQTPLAAALGEYGRIVSTNFLLRYCADP
jgi:TnpA family transposase